MAPTILPRASGLGRFLRLDVRVLILYNCECHRLGQPLIDNLPLRQESSADAFDLYVRVRQDERELLPVGNSKSIKTAEQFVTAGLNTLERS